MSNKFLIVLSAPSGCGKTSLENLILKNRKDIKKSISYTTRPIRKGEANGKDYFFISKKKFEEMKKNGEFLEYAKVFDHEYGTSLEFVEKERKKDFKVTKLNRFKQRTRYFTDSGIIGSKAYVQTTYLQFKDYFQTKNEKIPKHIKGLDDIYSLKRLKE